MKKVYPTAEERALQLPLHEYGIIPRESLPYLRRRIAEEIQAAIQDAEEWTTERLTSRPEAEVSRCPRCNAAAMADGARGVCNSCGYAWDNNPLESALCVCGHMFVQHDARGDACGVFLNDYLGDCPCESFRLS